MRLNDIQNVAVLGTGTMGPGIAQLFAQAGCEVSMWGRTEASVKRGLDRLRSNLEVFRQNRLISKKDAGMALARVKGCTSLEDAIEGASFVVEAIAEDLALKKDYLRRTGPDLRQGRYPLHQHLRAERHRHRLGHPPAGESGRHPFLEPSPTGPARRDRARPEDFDRDGQPRHQDDDEE